MYNLREAASLSVSIQPLVGLELGIVHSEPSVNTAET